MPPHIFPRMPLFLGLTLGDKRTTPQRPEIYLQNLSTQYVAVWSSKKAKEGVGLFKFHKRGKFVSLINTKCYLG